MDQVGSSDTRQELQRIFRIMVKVVLSVRCSKTSQMIQ